MFPEGRALEFLIAAVVALVVVGPKDLPMLLRKLGQFMARVRAMAAEFRASFDEMARQSELDELRKEVEAMRKAQMGDIAAQVAAPEMAQTFNELSQGLTDVGVDLQQSTAYPYTQLTQTETIEVLPAPRTKRAGKKAAKAAPKVAPKTAAKGKPAPKATSKPAAKPAAKTSAKATAKPKAARTPKVEGAPRRRSAGSVT